MSAGWWVAVVVAGVVALFVSWVWLMNRIDKRAERRQRDQIRHDGPPVLGGWRQPGPQEPESHRRRGR